MKRGDRRPGTTLPWHHLALIFGRTPNPFQITSAASHSVTRCAPSFSISYSMSHSSGSNRCQSTTLPDCNSFANKDLLADHSAAAARQEYRRCDLLPSHLRARSRNRMKCDYSLASQLLPQLTLEAHIRATPGVAELG